MPEAVIVATARSPIGRAAKGSLRDLRPDDLAATIVQAALLGPGRLVVHRSRAHRQGCRHRARHRFSVDPPFRVTPA